jgi:ribosomal protein S2
MRILNKNYLLNNGVFIGEKNYNYRTKSIIFKKLYSNFVFDFYHSLFFLKKALKLIVDIVRNRGVILIYCKNESNPFLKKLSSFNKRFIIIKDTWIAGSLSNYKTKNLNSITKLPDLVIVLNKSNVENSIILGEASCLSIPSIVFLSSNSNIDLISYPVWANLSSLKVINLFLVLIYNSVLQGLFKEKMSKVKKRKKLKNSFYIFNKKKI